MTKESFDSNGKCHGSTKHTKNTKLLLTTSCNMTHNVFTENVKETFVTFSLFMIMAESDKKVHFHSVSYLTANN